MLLFTELLLVFARDVFLWIGVGFLLARLRWLQASHFNFILQWLVVRTLFPLLIFSNIWRHLTMEQLPLTILLAVAASVMIVMAALTSIVVCRVFRPAYPRIFQVAGSLHNYGFAVYPLVQSLLGAASLPLAFVFIVTCDVWFWIIGKGRLTAHWAQSVNNEFRLPVLRAILSAPLVAVIAGLLFVISGWRDGLALEFPAWLSGTAQAAIPMALISIGGISQNALRSQTPAITRLIQRDTVLLLGLRQVLLPLCWGVILALIPLKSEVRVILAIEAVMPASLGIIFLVSLYTRPLSAPRLAATVAADIASQTDYQTGLQFCTRFSLISNLLGLITVPLWLSLGLLLFQLD
ncbi:MAG: hypothetical protein KDK39_01145 [Leptospiraceae bacterium]|nr:hypothetical protein [Leptospiraceae bacterium]